MFKSEMCKLYNDIYGDQMLDKVFNSRLEKLLMEFCASFI